MPHRGYAELLSTLLSTLHVEYSHLGELSMTQAETYAVAERVRSRRVNTAEEIRFARAREIPHGMEDALLGGRACARRLNG